MAPLFAGVASTWGYSYSRLPRDVADARGAAAYAADCRVEYGARLGEPIVPTYVDEPFWFPYAGCRPIFAAGHDGPPGVVLAGWPKLGADRVREDGPRVLPARRTPPTWSARATRARPPSAKGGTPRRLPTRREPGAALRDPAGQSGGDGAALTCGPTRRGYTERLQRLESVWWKRWLDVQRPYRWNLRRLHLGYVLDVGCGTGREPDQPGRPERGVGVDHNPESVAAARARGLEAFLPEEFRASRHARAAGSTRCWSPHVLEHMPRAEATALLAAYLPHVRARGQVVLITPQEAGHRSDETHVAFTDLDALADIAGAAGLAVERRLFVPVAAGVRQTLHAQRVRAGGARPLTTPARRSAPGDVL